MGYPKPVYEKAWTILNGRRDNARILAAERHSEIAKKIPAVIEIERQMAAAAAGITKSMLAAPDKAGEIIESIGNEVTKLQEERAKLLESFGYPKDYLSEKPFCPLCNDKGYINTSMCDCLKDLLLQQAREYLSYSAPAEDCTFSNFKLSFYPDTVDTTGVNLQKRMGEIYRFCMDYAEKFSPNSESLLFLGQTGLGKTHLSLAIAQTVTERGYGVIYTPAQKLMDRLESEKFSRNAESGAQYLENLDIALNCDLLILDDLGTEFTTSFTSSALYNIVNTRIVERRPTIVSTNLDPQAIEHKYSQRMVSRLMFEYRVLKFLGKDIRFVRKMNMK